ncbi:hypothetical protein [Metabacillus arenae]|uniref:Uncharacterized protein n=1 Tax=Metabacillus arenae TaxID=2771434 RepID=A0A926S147_9BACI|nr:hypothetical protein [Metabacillus arenae]MBD1380659.1 hypothetical protein [Metabacillus arenae]
MNNYKWMNNLNNLINKGGRLPLFNMFGRRRRRNRGMVWTSILGLGISAVVMGLRGNQNKNFMRPFRNFLTNFQTKNNQNPVGMQNRNAFAEFSNELSPNMNSDKTNKN